jgi:hypothetical protein
MLAVSNVSVASQVNKLLLAVITYVNHSLRGHIVAHLMTSESLHRLSNLYHNEK